MRLLIFGNSGSGKSTLARAVAKRLEIPHLDLDHLAWDPGPRRRAFEETEREIQSFIQASGSWVIEGCYGDLIEVAVPKCDKMRFLNPGVETCIENCRSRPWEPEKYATPEAQDENLGFLLGWVRDYETRTDEFSLARHRRIFEDFAGAKRELKSRADAAREAVELE